MTRFVPGTYSASAKSMHTPLTVSLTVNGDKITNAKVDLGKKEGGFKKAADQLADEIVDTQTTDVDAITGASVTSRAVRIAGRKALMQADNSIKKDLGLKDGTYKGSGSGHMGPVEVAVTCKNNKISDVKVVDQHESPHVADYAMKKIPQEIVEQQTLNVDAISGATVTSQAIITGAGKAIDQAGDSVSWSMQPYHKEKVEVNNQTADLAIAGAGLGGLATAAFAVKRGLKPILIEKGDEVGGSFRYAAGAFATHGSKTLEKLGHENDLEGTLNWIKELCQHDGHRKIDMDFVRYIFQRSGKTFDELLDICKAKPNFFLSLPYTAAGFTVGADITEKLVQYIKDNGGKFIIDTQVNKILMNGNKATGLECENSAGKFTVSAKNVIIATGGASYQNKAMLQKNLPSLKNVHVFNEASLGNTGDGYKLLGDIGADFYKDDVYKNAELDFTPLLDTNYSNEPDYSKAIVINDEGKRFTNEAPFSFLDLTTALYREGSPRYYLIYSGSTVPKDFLKKLKQLPQGPKTAVFAHTVNELAVRIGYKSATLQKTIADYNKACASGKDKFGKAKENLVKFNPDDGYWAVYTMPGSWGTIGGVKINHEMQVLKPDGNHFDNLYAVGEISTGALFSDLYMIGFSLADYSTEGRLVAEEI